MAHTGRRQSWGPRLSKPGLCERLSEGSSRRGRGRRPPKACEVAGQRIFSVESLRMGVAQSRVLGCSGLRPRTLEQTSIQARLWLWCSRKPAYLTGQTHLCTDIRASPVNGPVFWSASPSTVARCGPSSRASSLGAVRSILPPSVIPWAAVPGASPLRSPRSDVSSGTCKTLTPASPLVKRPSSG